MIVLDLSILNQKGTPMFNSDTFANRPAFGIVGRIFISTDTKEFFRDTGTSWELIGGPGSGTITGSGAATQVAFWNGTSSINGSNNLFWDSTNNYLGIQTNAPGNPLDVHGSISSIAALNQTTATNNTLLSLLNSGTPLWRIGNFYTAGANDFGIFDVVNTLQQLTIVKATGQTFIGAKTTASGRLVVNSATADNHLQIVGANSPSIRIDNAGSGGTQRFAIGNATATNNFIQGSVAGDFCITTASAGALLFGMWQTTNASEVMRITTANNLLIGSSVDNGNRLQVTGSGTISGNVAIGISTTNSFQAHIFGSIPLLLTSNSNANVTTYGAFQMYRQSNTIGNGVGLALGMQNLANANIETGYIGTIITANTTGSENGDIAFYTTLAGVSRNERLRIVSNGNLQLGTISGGNWRFLCYQNASTGSPNSSSLMARQDGTDDIAQFWGGASVLATIKSNGNLLIGSSVDNGNRFQLNGTGYITGVTNIGSVTTGTHQLNVYVNGGADREIFIAGVVGVSNGFRVRYDIATFQVRVSMTSLPTSPVGLLAGDLWNNLGILNIV